MAIRPVRELPSRGGGPNKTESYVAKDVREFVRNGYAIACVEVPCKATKHVQLALKNYIKMHQDTCHGISAVVRQGKAYLVREEAL